jgi:hypothetical protein
VVDVMSQELTGKLVGDKSYIYKSLMHIIDNFLIKRDVLETVNDQLNHISQID